MSLGLFPLGAAAIAQAKIDAAAPRRAPSKRTLTALRDIASAPEAR